MTTKTLTIMEEAYDALDMEKRPNESFSEVVLRITKGKGSIMDCFGAWKMNDEEWKKIRKKMDERWIEFEKDMRREVAK